MSQPILTIAIPTYNRAGNLDKQLAWAVNAIAGRWDQAELIVSDNGSPDKTPEVCQAWQQKTDGRLRVFRQPRNIGLPRNAIFCIQQARGEFIWLVSDDDEIADHTLDWLLAQLSDHRDDRLALIHFNLTIRKDNGTPAHERVHPFYQDRYSDPSIPLFEECSKFVDISMILLIVGVSAANCARGRRAIAGHSWKSGLPDLPGRLCRCARGDAGAG